MTEMGPLVDKVAVGVYRVGLGEVLGDERHDRVELGLVAKRPEFEFGGAAAHCGSGVENESVQTTCAAL